ncbi:MAG: MlaD family protein [Ignavibacteria bacterium]|nr:MlaD family protein [Ignavibacteria bacterium]
MELKVGVVSVLATALLIIGIIVGRGYQVSVSMQTIKMRFQNSGGLQVSSPVVVNGVKRGVVSSVVNDKGSVLVTATLDHIEDLRKDASATITILEITGGKKVEINPGISDEPFDPMQEIPGVTASDFAELVSQMGILFSDVKNILNRLDTTLTATNKIFGSEKFINNTNQSIENLNTILTSVKDILVQNQSNIDKTLRNLREISSQLSSDYSYYQPKLKKIITNLEVISDETTRLLSKGEITLRTVDTLVSEINSVLTEFRTKKSFANRLIFDEQLGNRLDSTLALLNDFVTQLKKHGLNTNVRLGTRP